MVKQTAGHGMGSNWGDSPMPLGPAVMEDNPAVESFARIEFRSGSMRHDENVFNEFIWFVDPAFMDMFSFKVLYGNSGALKNKNQIILGKSTAEKLFGNVNPVGEPLSIKFSNETKEEFVVGGVLESLPGNSSIRFDNLMSIKVFEDLKITDATDWSFFSDATLIMLKEGHTISEVSRGMEKYKALQNQANVDWPIQEFKFYLLNGLSRMNNEIDGEISMGAHPAGMITLGVISFMLLLLACFNYMNVAVATVTTRLKEIGIRKVVGGRKNEIIMQFLIENLVLCIASVVGGVLLAYLFFMPGLNSLFPITVTFESGSVTALLIFLASILFFVGLVSGAYPAVYVSSFQPAQILRGKEK
ncbi:MAG: ABC transporter permease, partial [Cyclobacteriaceae bacterium]